MKILVVEDDDNYMTLLHWRLENSFSIQSAKGLKSALVALSATVFDAVLLDVGLPDADRDTIVEEVKQRANGAAIIVLSGYEDTDYMRRAISQSASNYLVKGRDDGSGEALACHIRTGIKLNHSCQSLDRDINHLKQSL